MNRWTLIGLVLVFCGVYGMLRCADQIAAAEIEAPTQLQPLAHHQGLFFPIARSFYPQMLEMERTGQWVWHYQQLCTNANIYPDIQGALLDSMYRYQIDAPEIPGQGQANISDCGASFVGRCGAQAVACVGSDYPGYPVNCNARYNGTYMATFYAFASRKAVPKHEWKHCSARRAEGYKDDTATLSCIPSNTIMGCGPNSPQDYTSVDDSAWRQEHTPKGFSGFYGAGPDANGVMVAYYCGADNDRGIRVAVMVRAPDGIVYWSGNYMPVTPGCHSIEFYGEPGWTLLFNPENAFSWKDPLMRHDIAIVKL